MDLFRPGRQSWFDVMKILLLILLQVPSYLAATTLRVPGEYGTIQAAVDAAMPGDTVEVFEGTYRERITLKPGLILRSAGDGAPGEHGLLRAERTIMDGRGPGDAPGVRMAEGAVLDGFTITGVGRYDALAWKKAHAVQGEGQSHEHIGAFGIPGIGAENVTSHIINNIVHHNGFTGIALSGADNQSVVKSNRCYRNMGGGIGAMDGCKAEIRGNTCYENFFAGIGHAGADTYVIDNICYANIRAGIGISEGASPLVVSNRCYRNRRAGIGIRTGEATRPELRGNECYLNDMSGIGIKERAEPILVGNHCYSNTLAGIGAQLDASPRIESNILHDNVLAGIGLSATEHGQAWIRGNRVFDHPVPALAIQSGWKVVVEDNDFSRAEGLPPVIMVFAGAEGIFTGNRITGPGVAGIRVGGRAVIRGNRLDGLQVRKGGPPHYGVWVLEGGKVEERENVFMNWREKVHR